jgi:hypothetical protein
MALMNNISNESDKLVQQLAGLLYLVDINQSILNQNPISKEFLVFKLEIAQSLVEESQIWGTLGNQIKRDSLMKNAQFFLDQAQVLLDLILDRHCKQAWLDFLKELKFSPYASINYDYVLNSDIKACPRTVAG